MLFKVGDLVSFKIGHDDKIGIIKEIHKDRPRVNIKGYIRWYDNTIFTLSYHCIPIDDVSFWNIEDLPKDLKLRIILDRLQES
jgi:hypothetical protein